MIKIGSKFSVEATVSDQMSAAVAGSGALPVFGTPFMLAMMESAAMQCLQPFLEEGQGSVGTHLNVSHESPTPIGTKVRAEAEIIAADTKMVEFKVTAYDEVGLIGQGTHQRAVIASDRFLTKCNAKLEKR